jgi:hypothetical protein
MARHDVFILHLPLAFATRHRHQVVKAAFTTGLKAGALAANC